MNLLFQHFPSTRRLPLAIYLCFYHMTVFVSASLCVNYIYCTDYTSISISHPLYERDLG